MKEAQQDVISSALQMKKATADIEKESLNIELDHYKEAIDAEKDALKKSYDERRKMLEDEHDKTKRVMDEIREALKEALNKEKDAFKEAIEDEKDSFKDLIDDYKNALNSSKEANDYQRNISEKAKEVANLQKQLSAYGGDDSEENRARLQRLRVDLDRARDELQQSEYDKFISDQTELLDTIYDKYEQMSNKRLDELEGRIEEQLEAIQDRTVDLSALIDGRWDNFETIYDVHSGELKAKIGDEWQAYKIQYNEKTGEFEAVIGEDIRQLDVSYGQMMEGWEEDFDTEMDNMEQALDSQINELEEKEEAFTDEMQAKMDDVQSLFEQGMYDANNNIQTVNSTIQTEADEYQLQYNKELEGIGRIENGVVTGFDNVKNILNTINNTINGMTNTSNAKATTTVSTAQKNTQTTSSSKATTTTATKPVELKASSSKPATSNNNNWGSWFISKKDSYPKNKLNINGSIVDRLKYRDIDSSFNARAKYYSAMGGSGSYSGTASQNTWMLNQMKSHGYRKGTRHAGGMAWTQENGEEYIIRKSDGALLTPLARGDAVLSNTASNNLYQFANDPFGFLSGISIGARPNSSAYGNSFGDISVTITLPNVQNYEDFKNAMQHDKNFEKMVRAMTTDKLFGGSSLKKYKY